jgi:hypothetical protein
MKIEKKEESLMKNLNDKWHYFGESITGVPVFGYYFGLGDVITVYTSRNILNRYVTWHCEYKGKRFEKKFEDEGNCIYDLYDLHLQEDILQDAQQQIQDWIRDVYFNNASDLTIPQN